jgi:starch phosphorylase
VAQAPAIADRAKSVPSTRKQFRTMRGGDIMETDYSHLPCGQDEDREHVRTGMSVESLKRALLDNLFYVQGRFQDVATAGDYYQALAYTIRDRILHCMIQTAKAAKYSGARTVCYFSAEYLLGPHLGNNILNLGIETNVRQTVSELGLDLDQLLEQEEEPGLGNGGLGRLAACYLDSLASARIPAIGYGIRYEFGIFDQEINDGWQVEVSDNWLHEGNPWEIRRPKLTFQVKLGGHTECKRDDAGRHYTVWVPDRVVNGVAYDTPILGYRVNNANLLRLWKAEAPESFNFRSFNAGDYYCAVYQKMVSENLTKVLYPNDEPAVGKQLRLEQQYFFVSCSLQDMIRVHKVACGNGLDSFHKKFAIQLNDTHPSIAVVELMRLLIDEHGMDWDSAWNITRNTFAYTNHTLLPEALEKWPVQLFQSLLPRLLEIIYEINQRFLDELRLRYPWDNDRIMRMSLIEEGNERCVRMAHLACVGSYAINGVAELHTDLLKSSVLRDFHELWPEKFSNKTNGVTPRRFMALSNPHLRRLISSRIGDSWITDLDQLQQLEQFADDTEFHRQWRACKQANKSALADHILEHTGIAVDPASMFDIQVKRLHEYKRQHLNVLHIITLYNRLKQNPGLDIAPRTFIFGGKAAPGYRMAKLIIKLINSVGDVISRDPDVRDRLKVVYVPNFNVKNSRWVYPAADLSEQISTAGKEASGTGNMKFSLNGALTIGTLDGANVEIREQVGHENFFLFGLTAKQVRECCQEGYHPREFYERNPRLKEVIDLISNGFFSHGDADLFRPLVDSLLNGDPYMLLADYQSYVNAQDEATDAYLDQEHWTHMSILNVARTGKFSSDRAIREYCADIWKVGPMDVALKTSSPAIQKMASDGSPPCTRRQASGGVGGEMH